MAADAWWSATLTAPMLDGGTALRAIERQGPPPEVYRGDEEWSFVAPYLALLQLAGEAEVQIDDLEKRKGPDADRPHRVKYRSLVRG